MPIELQLLLCLTGILACVTRIWWVWWTSTCVACGHAHRTCVCPPPPDLMRRRK